MERNNNSDKTAFKVEFLGEYHDMVIDWNDDKYEYKEQQVFEQLESLTGIPSKYKISFHLIQARPHLHKDYPFHDTLLPYEDPDAQRSLFFFNRTHFPQNDRFSVDFVKDNIHDVCILDGERFHLQFHVCYNNMVLKRIGIGYYLVPEIWVEEGVCTRSFCQHTQTKSYFKRIKDLVTNEGLNSQISHRIQPLQENMGHHDGIHWFMEMEKIYREFNVQQFLRNNCHLNNWHERMHDEDGIGTINLEQYQRMRG